MPSKHCWTFRVLLACEHSLDTVGVSPKLTYLGQKALNFMEKCGNRSRTNHQDDESFVRIGAY